MAEAISTDAFTLRVEIPERIEPLEQVETPARTEREERSRMIPGLQLLGLLFVSCAGAALVVVTVVAVVLAEFAIAGK